MSIQPAPIFIIGNKRSGTTLLGLLLNLHPEVFVSHESDIIWLLFQAQNEIPDKFTCYEGDSCAGMLATLRASEHVLRNVLDQDITNQQERIYGAFVDTLYYIMRNGSAVQLVYPGKENLTWIGDKKPVQQCDPRIRPFIYENFPNLKCLHIIRHPFAVVSSELLYVRRDGKEYPKSWEATPDDALRRWLLHEKWVLAMKDELLGNGVLTLRLEDLASNPAGKLEEAFDFLELSTPEFASQVAEERVDPEPNKKYETFIYNTTPELLDIMGLYGYGFSLDK